MHYLLHHREVLLSKTLGYEMKEALNNATKWLTLTYED